jgi:hypothetical protein
MLSSARACRTIEHSNERTVVLGLGRLAVLLVPGAACSRCARHVRFEGSRLAMLRVSHHATNEWDCTRSLCDFSYQVCFSQRHRTIDDRWDRLVLPMW